MVRFFSQIRDEVVINKEFILMSRMIGVLSVVEYDLLQLRWSVGWDRKWLLNMVHDGVKMDFWMDESTVEACFDEVCLDGIVRLKLLAVDYWENISWKSLSDWQSFKE